MVSSGLKVIVLLLLALNATSCSDSKTIEQYLSQAASFSEKKDLASAIITLKNAARLESNNALVRFKLASAYLDQGDYLSAEKEFEKAKKLGATNEFLYAKLIETKVKLYKINEVFPLVEQAQNTSDNEFIIVLTYAGIAALHAEDTEKANDYFDQAIGLSSNSVYSKLGKVYLSYGDGKDNNRLAIIDELLISNPDFTEALLLKGYILQNTQQFSLAAETFQQYASLRPKEIQIHFLIAQNYVSAEKFTLAEPEVNFLLKVSSNNPVANQLKAQIEFQKQDYIKAQTYSRKAYQQNHNLVIARMISGLSAYQLKDFEQAYQDLLALNNQVSDDHLIKKIIIDLQLKLGYDVDALNSLRSLVDLGEADTSMLTIASYQLLKTGNTEGAQELLESSIQLNTKEPTEIAKQGLMKLQLKQSDKGIEILDKALKLDPELTLAEQGLAVGYLVNEQYANALTIAKKWQGEEGKIIQGFLLESSILEKQGNSEHAKKLCEKVISIDENNIAALYKLALYAHQANNTEQAYRYYTRVISLQPKHMRAASNFIRLISANQNLLKQANDFYQKIITDSVGADDGLAINYAKLGLAYIHRIGKEYQLSVDVLEQINKSITPLKGIEILLGDSYKLLKRWDKATDSYLHYVNKNPQDLMAAHKLFTLYEQTKQVDKALQQVEKTLSYHSNNAGLSLLKVYYQSLLLVAADKDLMNELSKKEAIKNHWLYDKTLGNIAYNNKSFSLSSKHYQAAYQKNKNDANAFSWAKSVSLAGDKSQAVDILQRQLESNKDSVQIQVLLAGALLNNQQKAQAMTLYRKIVANDNKNFLALNNLAYLELKNSQFIEALAHAEQAVKLANSSVGVLDTYAQTLVANNKAEQALGVYNKAIELIKTNKGSIEIKTHKAEAFIILQHYEKAEKLLSNLLAHSEVSSDEKMKIEQLLSTISH